MAPYSNIVVSPANHPCVLINVDQGISKLLETFSKKGRAKVIADASHILREEAKVRYPTLQYHQDRILRLKSFLGWSERRVRSIYNAEEGVSLRGAETIALMELEQAQKQRARNAEEAKSADGFKALEARFVALEAELASLRAALAGGPVEGQGSPVRGSVGHPDRSRPGSYGRRSTDRV